MRLLLLSHGLGAVPAFLASAIARPGPFRLAYIPDAALPLDGLPDDLLRLRSLGYRVDLLPLTATAPVEIASTLTAVDAVFVGGGNTFALLHALRSTGAARLLVDRVRAGLPYLGLSAGAVVAGPTIAPIAPMDDATEAPDLDSTDGLGLTDVVVVPHADGLSYPPAVISRIVDEYGEAHPLRLLRDGEALVVDEAGMRLVESE